LDNAEMLTPKEVGKRIKERRNEIGISMPELGRRVGVNKSTIQRYETDGVNPNRSMIINGLADALQTTPEWLTGLSEEKEVKDEDGRTICEGEVLDHLNSFLDAVSKTVQPEIQRRLDEAGDSVCAIDAINLLESGLDIVCDRTVAITSPTELRVRRIMARDNITERYARMRVTAQKPDEYYRGKCSCELSNDADTPEEVQRMARRFFGRLIRGVREEKQNKKI